MLPVQAIHLAARTGDVDMAGVLIQAGADVNAITSDVGYTPLRTAVHHSYTALIGFLLRAGARVSVGDHASVTPLHVAMAVNPTAVVIEILACLEKQDNNMLALSAALAIEDCQGRTLLHIAYNFGKLRCRKARKTHLLRSEGSSQILRNRFLAQPRIVPNFCCSHCPFTGAL